MASDPKDVKDISVSRILIVVLVLGSVFFLLTSISTYFPDHFDIIGRLAATLVCSVIVVKMHRNFDNSNRRNEEESRIDVPINRYATLKRILVVWLALFILNTVFLKL